MFKTFGYRFGYYWRFGISSSEGWSSERWEIIRWCAGSISFVFGQFLEINIQYPRKTP